MVSCNLKSPHLAARCLLSVNVCLCLYTQQRAGGESTAVMAQTPTPGLGGDGNSEVIVVALGAWLTNGHRHCFLLSLFHYGLPLLTITHNCLMRR